MKIFYFLLLSILPFCLQSQSWKWSKEKLIPGQDVTVTLNNIDTDQDLYAVGYYFQNGKLTTSDINFIVEDEVVKMTLKVPEQTNWLRIVVKDAENEIVSGDNKDVILAGAPAGASLIDFANATAAYNRLLGLTNEEPVTVKMYREAILASPSWMENALVLQHYYRTAKAAQAEEDLRRIQTFVAACEAEAQPSQDLLISAIRIAKDQGDTTLVKNLRRKLNTSYPQSLLAQEDAFMKFREATELADKIVLRDKFRAAYPVNEFNRGLHDQMTSSLIQECVNKSEWEKMEDYVNELVDPSTKASVCNNYAWTLAGEGLDNEASQLDLAARLSAASLQATKENKNVPLGFTTREWEASKEFSEAMYGDTYALILFKQGAYDDAIDYQAKAVEGYHYNDLEMNERYVVYLDKAGKKEETISFIEDMMKDGNSSAAMAEIHERLWNERSKEQLYDRYVSQLEAIAKERLEAEIKEKWMDMPVQSFSLKNLDGKQVSLDDYKGKTIVVDFWATWCGPCKASFPGMKNAVEHFANDPDVVFLFVDTWEGGDGVQAKVKKFITDNNYPFHVLMDSDNAVVESFDVDGIPTKFIIDGNQRIRFKSVGYGGNNEALVQELITMIGLAKNNGKIIRS